jgi:hypothetical protein
MPKHSSRPALDSSEGLEDDFGNLVQCFRREGDPYNAAYPSGPYDAPEPLDSALDYAAPIHLGPAEELPPPDSVTGSREMELQFRLERVLQERDNALSALEHERSQRDQRVSALNDEQERFVARMVREHEEEMFVSSRDARRIKDELRRTQQDLGKARREIGRLRGELESTQAELNSARDELQRRELVGGRESTPDFALQSHSRIRADGGDAELERLLVQYSRDMDSRPSTLTSDHGPVPAPAPGRLPQRARAAKPVAAKEERPRVLKKSRGR